MITIISVGTGQKGGIDSVISNIENALAKNFSSEFSTKRIITHRGDSKLVDLLHSIFGIAQIFYYSLFKRKAIFHLHMSYKGSFWRKLLYLTLARVIGRKAVTHLHGSEFKVFYESSSKITKFFVRYLVRKSDRFFVLSASWQKYINTYICNEARLDIIANFANVSQVASGKRVVNRILFLGALIDRKGIYDLLSAIKDIKDIELHVGGQGDLERFNRFISENNLDNKVVFHGWVDAVKKNELLDTCSILVLPSYNEGLPVVILEAMAKNVLVVTTAVGGIPDVIKDQTTGFIFAPGDVAALTATLNNVIHSDYSAVIARAKDIYDEYHDERVVMTTLTKSYRELLDEQSK